jgi:nucleotide-binding universal stress UspA family protein
MASYRKILVPVDGSPTSNLGLREALKLAGPDTRIRLVHVVDELVVVSAADATAPSMVDLVPVLKEAGQKILARSKSIVERAGAQVETKLIEAFGGGAAKEIVAEAARWKAQLICMGTHGRRGLRRLLLGSDAEEVIRTSPVPVLLARDRTEDLPKSTRARARR